ncbi:hypothetical protein [Umezawaea sp.]|uniref:hypothetical protein n=1 Tax=Umezawaea sp. TaxID=1955258 RepID=UPI002ED1EB93
MEFKAENGVTSTRRSSPVVNRVVLLLLGSAARRLVGRKVCGLRCRTVGGAIVGLPVRCVCDGDRLVVVAGGASGERWWPHFRADAPVEVPVGGDRVTGSAVVLRGAQHRVALNACRGAFPRVTADAEVVAITVDQPPAAGLGAPAPPRAAGGQLDRHHRGRLAARTGRLRRVRHAAVAARPAPPADCADRCRRGLLMAATTTVTGYALHRLLPAPVNPGRSTGAHQGFRSTPKPSST